MLEFLIISLAVNGALLIIFFLEKRECDKFEKRWMEAQATSDKWSQAYIELWSMHFKRNPKLPTIPSKSGKTTLYLVKQYHEDTND